jgi:hypothetical protein
VLRRGPDEGKRNELLLVRVRREFVNQAALPDAGAVAVAVAVARMSCFSSLRDHRPYSTYSGPSHDRPTTLKIHTVQAEGR